jgi:hypothetical protein
MSFGAPPKRSDYSLPLFFSYINGPFNWCSDGPCLDKCMLSFLAKFQLQVFYCYFYNISWLRAWMVDIKWLIINCSCYNANVKSICVCCLVVELFGVKPIELGSTCSKNLHQIHKQSWEPTSTWSPFGLMSWTRDNKLDPP